MAFQSVPNTAEITFVCEQNDEAVVNTIHAEKLGGYSGADIIALADTMDLAFSNHIKTQMVQDVLYLRTEVRGLNSVNDFLALNNDNTGQGTILGPGLPNNVTLSLKKSSALTGRSARGRLFWIGLAASELETNENLVDSNVAANKAIALQAVRGDIVAAGWDPVIVSRFSEGVQRAFGVTFEWLTTVAVNNEVDSQRGRLA